MDALLFRAVNEWRQIPRVSRGEDNAIDAALEEFFERFGISFPKHLNGTVHKFDSQLRNAASFVEDPAPELIVEEVDFPRHAYTNASAGLGNRESACRQIWRVAYLPRNLQDALTGVFLDASPAVQGAIHGADGNVRHLSDQMDSAPFFPHHLAPVLVHSIPAPFSVSAVSVQDGHRTKRYVQLIGNPQASHLTLTVLKTKTRKTNTHFIVYVNGAILPALRVECALSWRQAWPSIGTVTPRVRKQQCEFQNPSSWAQVQ
jgi:hypothetical protein